MCPDIWSVGHSTVPNQCNGFISPIHERENVHKKMNCRLVTLDAFKCLRLFKRKLKPRSEFSGGFLNKKIV